MSYIQGLHIADGFADDCDELMHRCLLAGPLTFEIFSDIWKEMQLSCIYRGRHSGAELAELSEEVLHIAKHYMVADTSNFEESVAGLFLVYSLMNLQPYAGFASLRIVQEDLPAIQRIELVARRDRRQDVLYVLGSVLIQGPVQYHAVPRERGMEYPIRKYLEGYDTVNKIGVRPKGVFYRQNTELDIIREIKNLTVRYKTAKENIPGVPRDDRNLNYLDATFASQLDSSLKKIINGIIDEGDKEGGDDELDAIKDLKARAMKAQVKPIRHLVPVADMRSDHPSKRKNSDTSPIDKSTKTNDKRGKKRRRSDDTSEDSSDLNSDIATADELLSDEELDLTKFNQGNNADEITDLEFEALDALREGQPCQIEFIDQMVQPSTSGVDLSDEEVPDTHKRDLKKTILKSRFKRMGMLPVANFDANDDLG